MNEEQQMVLVDGFTERLLEMLESIARVGVAPELVYNAAFAAAMTFGSRRTTMLQQAKDLHAMAHRLESEDDGHRRPSH
jgi:hypothetical protein